MNHPMPGRQPSCPLDLDLERALGGEPAFQHVLVHAQGCGSCSARVAWMREAGELFARRVLPATRDRVAEALRPRPFWEAARRWSMLAAPLAVAMVLAVLVPAVYPKVLPWYVGEKGGRSAALLPLQVYVGTGGKARQLFPGDEVHPGDGLRFVVEAPGRDVYLLSVDSQGQVSPLVPGGRVRVPQSGVIPGGSVLDDVLGPERLFAIEALPGLDLGAVEAAIRKAAVSGGARGVREASALPLRAPQGTLLLEKVAR